MSEVHVAAFPRHRVHRGAERGAVHARRLIQNTRQARLDAAGLALRSDLDCLYLMIAVAG